MKKQKEITKKDLKWTSFEDMVIRFSKNKEFKKGYEQEMSRIKLAHQIREMRNAKCFTQTTLARKAGMPQSMVARIERGERGISVETLRKVAHAFGKEVQLV